LRNGLLPSGDDGYEDGAANYGNDDGLHENGVCHD
jgi:hypothetical protein